MARNQKIQKIALSALGILLPMAVSRMARGAVGKGYERVTKWPPPRDPSRRDVPWKEAIVWAIVTGITGGLAKLASRRILAPTPVPVDQNDQEALDDPDFSPDLELDLD